MPLLITGSAFDYLKRANLKVKTNVLSWPTDKQLPNCCQKLNLFEKYRPFSRKVSVGFPGKRAEPFASIPWVLNLIENINLRMSWARIFWSRRKVADAVFAKYVFFSKVMACLFHLLPQKKNTNANTHNLLTLIFFQGGGREEKKELEALNFVAQINAFGLV